MLTTLEHLLTFVQLPQKTKNMWKIFTEHKTYVYVFQKHIWTVAFPHVLTIMLKMGHEMQLHM